MDRGIVLIKLAQSGKNDESFLFATVVFAEIVTGLKVVFETLVVLVVGELLVLGTNVAGVVRLA